MSAEQPILPLLPSPEGQPALRVAAARYIVDHGLKHREALNLAAEVFGSSTIPQDSDPPGEATEKLPEPRQPQSDTQPKLGLDVAGRAMWQRIATEGRAAANHTVRVRFGEFRRDNPRDPRGRSYKVFAEALLAHDDTLKGQDHKEPSDPQDPGADTKTSQNEDGSAITKSVDPEAQSEPAPKINRRTNRGTRAGSPGKKPSRSKSVTAPTETIKSTPEKYLSVKVGCAEWAAPGHGEDTILRNDVKHIYGVFDGMGSGDNPSLASRIGAEAIEEKLAGFEPPATTDEAIDQMRKAFDYARAKIISDGDGNVTTATVVRIVEVDGRTQIVIGNAGDSRAFIKPLDPQKYPIQNNLGEAVDFAPLTTDQSIGNAICNGMGLDKSWMSNQDEFAVIGLGLDEPVRIMICSDGITGDRKEQFLSDAEMMQALDKPDPQESADEFLRLSKKLDDKSVLVIDINSGKAAVIDPLDAAQTSGQPEASQEVNQRQALLGHLALGLEELRMVKMANQMSRLNQNNSDQKIEYGRATDKLIDVMIDYADTHNLNVQQQDILLNKVVRGLYTELDLAQEEIMRSLPVEMLQELGNALNHYTKLAAARECLSLMPQLTRKRIDAARERYEDLRRRAQWLTLAKLEQAGYGKADRIMIAKLDNKTDAKCISLATKFEADRLSEPQGVLAAQCAKFYDWWARQGGGEKFFSRRRMKGNLKKSGVMLAVGLPIGAAAGAAGIFLAGPVLGGAVAASIARGVSRGLMRSHVDRKAAGRTVSDEQFDKRLTEQKRLIDESYAGTASGYDVSRAFAEGTERSVSRRRRRTIGSALIGASFGALGAHFVGDWIHGSGAAPAHQALKPGVTQPPKSPHPALPPQPATTPPAPSHPSAPTSQPAVAAAEHGPTGQSFNVEYGSGEINAIQQYAATHNYNISPQQAYDIYQQLHAQDGSSIIGLNGSGPSTYLFTDPNGAPDMGLSHPGIGHWDIGVESQMRQLLGSAAAQNG